MGHMDHCSGRQRAWGPPKLVALRVLFGYSIPATWPRKGPVAGPEVSPLQEQASQASPQARAPQAEPFIPAPHTHLLQSLVLGCGRGPYLRGGTAGPTVGGAVLPEPRASGRPLLPSVGPACCSSLLVLDACLLSWEGSPGRRWAGSGTHPCPALAGGCARSGVCCWTRWGVVVCACDGGSQRHPRTSQ